MVPLKLGPTHPGLEEDVLVVGWHQERANWVAYPGIVLGPSQPDSTVPIGPRIWVTPVEIGSVLGFSGAPVVNSSLEVVAMAYKKYRETNDEEDRGLAHMLSLTTLISFVNEQSPGQRGTD